MEEDRAYSVGRSEGGRWVWWSTWTQAGLGATDVRYATVEEGRLMLKCEWHQPTAAELAQLQELLNQNGE